MTTNTASTHGVVDVRAAAPVRGMLFMLPGSLPGLREVAGERRARRCNLRKPLEPTS